MEEDRSYCKYTCSLHSRFPVKNTTVSNKRTRYNRDPRARIKLNYVSFERLGLILPLKRLPIAVSCQT